ncbi:hypothetical protein TIFTF001_038491 [Ficus carica]|uniref:Uncharacterized protein n=1 Tax=Ficus carica TaxID=3494 RepID=A0AA88E8W0_FICCA|nr:hypothetical protein TIFTF001_038463 [Ficus carica]GMN69418.1 hypothetical protein TIFTF001_038470 [Ficus carica]GMN69430.1 hypothetical protein TIFTF001_038484 [Ficus carica]GMN69439.1 hypothetical protein TIFTF001_038491 [Ficus carica]
MLSMMYAEAFEEGSEAIWWNSTQIDFTQTSLLFRMENRFEEKQWQGVAESGLAEICKALFLRRRALAYFQT